ncbi:MAG TPA: ABC transporter permease, partial [Pseudobdellovibrionaceae bacterium]|nr:ABC transporter permease [Pseudobdellovibrionaceae bacterium]
MFYLALRHLLSRRKQSLLTLLGILFGSMAFIAISGIMLGFRYYLIEKLVSSDAHIKITARETYLQERTLDDPFFSSSTPAHVFWSVPPSGRKDDNRIIDVQGWYRRIRHDPRVKHYSPTLMSQALLKLASAQVSATIIGCDPEKQTLTTNISSFIVEGNFSDLSRGGNRIFLGTGLMRKLGARVGQTLSLSVGTAESTPFKVMGTFRTGVAPVDDFRAYVELSDLQKLTNLRNVINEIGVTLHNLDLATMISNQWSRLGQEKVQSWEQANENLFSVFVI